MITLEIDDVGRRALSRARRNSKVDFNYGALGKGECVQSASLFVEDKSVREGHNGGPVCDLRGFLVGSEDRVQVRLYRGYKKALLYVS